MNSHRPAASIALAIALLMFASAAFAADSDRRVIEVNGTGEARTAPDVANLSVQIETHAATAEECSNRNAALAQKVVAELKNKLAGKGTVTTGDYALSPEYNQAGPNQNPAIVGYVAQNTITVETGEMAMLGALIDGAIAAGANRINSLGFGLRDDTMARNDAIAIAARDAQAQAQALAGALGVKLGRIVKASTVEESPIRPMMRTAAFASMAAAPTPIEATQVSVSATVSLTYEIE